MNDVSRRRVLGTAGGLTGAVALRVVPQSPWQERSTGGAGRLVALARAGARFERGQLVERPRTTVT